MVISEFKPTSVGRFTRYYYPWDDTPIIEHNALIGNEFVGYNAKLDNRILDTYFIKSAPMTFSHLAPEQYNDESLVEYQKLIKRLL